MTVCPGCFHDLHDLCIGAGCYCDCQLEELISQPPHDDEQEDEDTQPISDDELWGDSETSREQFGQHGYSR